MHDRISLANTLTDIASGTAVYDQTEYISTCNFDNGILFHSSSPKLAFYESEADTVTSRYGTI